MSIMSKLFIYQGQEIPNFDPTSKPKALVYVPGRILPHCCMKGVEPEQQQVLFLNDFWLLGKNLDEYYKAQEFLASLLREAQQFEIAERPPITKQPSVAG